MDVRFIIGFVLVLLSLSLMAEPLARRLRIPHSSVLVILGMIVGYVVTVVLGMDTGLRARSFHDLIFYVFLPILVFDAAFKICFSELRRNALRILYLAVFGMILTAGISAGLLYIGIGHPSGFPWIAALLAGALLAATDPVAVVAQLKAVGAPERLGVILEGESLFNDAVAIVLFSVFLTMATNPETGHSYFMAVLDFCLVFLGGAGVGMVAGALGGMLLTRTVDGVLRAAIILLAAYGSYLVAEGLLHVSGVMATLAAGLWLSAQLSRNPSIERSELDFVSAVLVYVANGSVFLLMGLTVTLAMFAERWLAMLIAIGAVIVARVVTVYGGLSIINLVSTHRLPMAEQRVIAWGGLRGAVTLALALSLPVELDYWWTIQSMAFGVVLFTLFVQAPGLPFVLRRVA